MRHDAERDLVRRDRVNLDDALSVYATESLPRYEKLAGTVDALIDRVLEAKDITFHSVTSRAKDPESLRKKATAEGKDYVDLSEITDLAGARVITYFPSQVDKVVSALRGEFTVDEANSTDKRHDDNPSVFGYASVHLVVEFDAGRASLPEYKQFQGLKCEVQVRTVLQHAWAEIEHDIVYKSEDAIPFELRRRFACLAGMLELADKEFEAIRTDGVRVRATIENIVRGDQLHVEVSLDALQVYLEQIHGESDLSLVNLNQLVKLANLAGIRDLQSLHAILTPAALRAAAAEADRANCPSGPGCPIKYFVCVGRWANMRDNVIAKLAGCPDFGASAHESSPRPRQPADRVVEGAARRAKSGTPSRTKRKKSDDRNQRTPEKGTDVPPTKPTRRGKPGSRSRDGAQRTRRKPGADPD